MSPDSEQRVELSIEGRVQGVGFRHFTVTTARDLEGVTGWVKNESDGSVTLVAEGPRQQLDQLLEAVRKGPRRARVENIEQSIKDPEGTFSSFEVRY